MSSFRPPAAGPRGKEIVIAAVLQGALLAAVSAVVDRSGARAFECTSGEWPGDWARRARVPLFAAAPRTA